MNVNGNESVDTDGGINKICITGIPMIERDEMVNLQATINVPSGNQHNGIVDNINVYNNVSKHQNSATQIFLRDNM